MALLRPSSRSRKLSVGVFFLAMFLARSWLQSDGFDQAGLLQSFLLRGIHDQRSLVSRLKGAAPLQEQVNGAAVLTGFDSDRDGHDCSLSEADIRPETTSRLAQGRRGHQTHGRGHVTMSSENLLTDRQRCRQFLIQLPWERAEFRSSRIR